MALSGLQIQKLLPKTNCKECGSNTCLAFAMKLAAKKADLSECPYASDEAKSVLGAASEPPVKGVRFGVDSKIKAGEETVLYRHEKTFVSQTLIAININDTDPAEEAKQKLLELKDYVIERVGEKIGIDMICVTDKSGNAESFAAFAKNAYEITNKPLIIHSPHLKSLTLAAESLKGTRCVLASAVEENALELAGTAKVNRHILAVTAPDLNGLVKTTEMIKANDFNDLILNYQSYSLPEGLETNSIARRSAIKDNYKPLGYASICFINHQNLLSDTVEAITEITKYGSICVLPDFDKAQLASLFTLRLNIYTDPQKPIQVDPKVYPIGEPKPDSPVFLTTNFSLTYFIVSGEIENSGISAWLVVPQCEGMSVLTAWAAGKFSGSIIAKFIKEIELEKQITARIIIIPGYVSQISGELEENLPGWKVMVGPQEAADLESFVKARLKN